MPARLFWSPCSFRPHSDIVCSFVPGKNNFSVKDVVLFNKYEAYLEHYSVLQLSVTCST